MLLNDFLAPPNRTHTIIAIFVLTFICVGGSFYLQRFWLKVLVPICAVAGWGAMYLYGFSVNSLFDGVPPVAGVLLSSGVSMGYIALTEGREKLKVKRMFSQYVSPEVLDIMMNSYSEFLSAGAGAKVDISVLFSDIRSFTTFSDKTTPEKVVEMLNCHFSHMTEAIFQNKGTIDKYIGDAIMAFWGAPVKLEDHPERAVRAALEMTRKVKDVNARLKEMDIDFDLHIGIGINSGEAILGNIGSERKLNYTVIGDTVNLASRLEALNKNYDAPIIISEFTFNRISGDIPCRVLDTVKVRGKEIPVRIYEPMAFGDEESRRRVQEVCELTNRAFALFEKGDYNDAKEMYNKLENSKLKELFLERCEKAIGEGKNN
jgi:adenylate cyclase